MGAISRSPASFGVFTDLGKWPSEHYDSFDTCDSSYLAHALGLLPNLLCYHSRITGKPKNKNILSNLMSNRIETYGDIVRNAKIGSTGMLLWKARFVRNLMKVKFTFRIIPSEDRNYLCDIQNSSPHRGQRVLRLQKTREKSIAKLSSCRLMRQEGRIKPYFINI